MKQTNNLKHLAIQGACCAALLCVPHFAVGAMFSAEAMATLNFPPTVVNTFGYSVPTTANKYTNVNAIGNAYAGAAEATYAYGGGVMNIGAGPVSGFAGAPYGSAGAISYIDIGDTVGFDSIVLANLSNAVFVAHFTGSFEFDLVTDGGPPLESSVAAATLIIHGTDPVENFILGGIYSPIVRDGADFSAIVPFDFDVTLQPASTRDLRLSLSVAGSAKHIPEPSTISIIGIGFLSLFGVLSRSKRLRKKSHFQRPVRQLID